MLFGQGTTDTLFTLQQGLANWQHAITKQARKDSIFVGYNGGHVLPVGAARRASTSPPTRAAQKLAGGDFADLALRFLDEQLKGKRTGLKGYGRFHLATPAARCTTVRLRPGRPTATTSARSPRPRPRRRPARLPVAEGPIRHRRLAVPHRRP